MCDLLEIYKELSLFCAKRKIFDNETKKPLICYVNRDLLIDFIENYPYEENDEQVQLSAVDMEIEHNEEFDLYLTMFWGGNDFVDQTLEYAKNLMIDVNLVDEFEEHLSGYDDYRKYLSVVLDETNLETHKKICEKFERNITRICNKLSNLLKQKINIRDFIYENTPEGRVLMNNIEAIKYITPLIEMNNKLNLIKYDYY